MTQAVIFDMDGVIIDSEPIHKAAEKEVFSTWGISLTESEHAALTGSAGPDIWRSFRETHDLSVSLDIFMQTHEEKYLELLEAAQPMEPIPGARPLIEGLHARGIPLALASSASEHEIQIVMDLFQLHDYFPIKISGATLPQSKPHPGIFLKAAELLNMAPKHCLVIEDSANGVRAAKAAGMYCIAYAHPAAGYQDHSLADERVTDLREIGLERWN